MFGDPAKHVRTYLVSIMKSEDEVRPPVAGKHLVRSGLPLDQPTHPNERSENLAGFC